MTETLFALVAGTTETARIDGISAAGADPAVMAHTPSADAEILTYGETAGVPVVPVSPTGCPTPAVVTRAVREELGFESVVLDAGLAKPTAAPTHDLGGSPGRDVRESVAVPDAESIHGRARAFGRAVPTDRLVVGETIPGGTTTAKGVLTALGERGAVSSSLPENPVELKREVVTEGLAASDVERGDFAGDPLGAVRAMGDPVLAAVAGLVRGARESETSVTLAGGTQLAAAAALVRHAESGGEGEETVETDLELATTSFLAADDSAAIRDLAADLSLSLTVTDPEFDARPDHPAMAGYLAGEAKEGVGMGGALALAAEADLEMERVRESITTVYDRLTDS
ncbi:MAG: nicotinate mononucleotide-dependent phosphoribosyltransferase CobT [Halobaculum sp.]